MHETSFLWVQLIPGLRDLPIHVSNALVLIVVLVACLLGARAQLKRAMQRVDGGIIPEAGFSLRNIFEIAAEALYKLVQSVIGKELAPTYYALIGSLFVFIFTSNVMGLIPGFSPPTTNLNTTLALGLFVFVAYNAIGIKANGLVGYLKHFVGPVWWLFFMMIPIEIVSHVIRPVSLALRLRGNIMGDHLVLEIFQGMVPYVVPVIFLGLGLFVSFIQAFVFCLLTMIYISMATAHDH